MSDSSLAESNGSRIGLWGKRLAVAGVTIGVIGGTVVMMGVMQAAAPKPEKKEETVEAMPVLTTSAREESIRLTVLSQGEVTARSQVNLAAEVGGRVQFVSTSFLPGGAFKAGDVLLRLDPREYQLRVTQAEAAVAQAKTALRREESEADNARLNAQELGLEGVSDLALREPQVAEAHARLAAAEASLAEARLNLERTVIRAPFSGRIKEKYVDLGAFIAPGTPLGLIFSSDVMEVPLALTDTDLSKLSLGIGYEAGNADPGPFVTLSAIVAGSVHEWTGQIKRTDSSFDPETRVLYAYVVVEDPYGAGADDGVPLAAGLYVDAFVEGRNAHESIVVPRTALRGTDKVFVVRDDETLEIRTVEVSSSDRQKAVISNGLSVGERVIVSPVRGAADGVRVKPVDAADANSGEKVAVLSSEDTDGQEN